MKVVKQKSTGKVVYRQSPDFEKGKGLLSASVVSSVSVDDLKEVEITQLEWDALEKERVDKITRNGKIEKEMYEIAEKSLIDRGEI